MTRCSFGALAAILVLAGSLVSAQAPAPPQGRAGGPPPAPPTNLQVLPKDWTRQQVVQVMQQFNQALGVQCSHCHQFIGPGDPNNDMATDIKPQKNIARAMMRMTQGLNIEVPQAVQKTSDKTTRVGCIMCHRGSAIPEVPPPAVPPGRAGAPAGAPANPPVAPGGR